jgi:flavin-dependent dehydrogenase
LLCGDAGGFTSPLTKGGVYGAVWSGRLAGEALVRALAGDPGEAGFAGYARSVAGHPSRNPRQVRVSRAFLEFDDQVINTMGRVMNRKVFSAKPVLRCTLELLRRPTPKTLRILFLGLAIQRSYVSSARFAW